MDKYAKKNWNTWNTSQSIGMNYAEILNLTVNNTVAAIFNEFNIELFKMAWHKLAAGIDNKKKSVGQILLMRTCHTIGTNSLDNIVLNAICGQHTMMQCDGVAM